MTETKTKADKIRDAAKRYGHDHTNKFFKLRLEAEHGERFTLQQIAAVLGRYRDRAVADRAAVHEAARRFICLCQNDTALARKIVAAYEQ